MEWYTGEGSYFINPYNFIKTDFQTKPTKDIEDDCSEEKHTGVLDCTLITKTPLAVPDTSQPLIQENKHKEYDFIRNAEGKPMIPASSLRGPIRSMYETLTDSCFATDNKDTLVTYRTREAFQPGLLHRTTTGWEIYEAKRYLFAVDSNKKNYAPFNQIPGIHHMQEEDLQQFRYGQEVYFKPLREGGQEKEYMARGRFLVGTCIQDGCLSGEQRKGCRQTGYFCKGEPFPGKKHFESVFRLSGTKLNISKKFDLQKYIESLDEVVKCYNDEVLNRNAKTRKYYQDRSYKNASMEVYLPIWYCIREERGQQITKLHLSVASLGRSVYIRTMEDMLGAKKSCTERSSLCAACRLFGMAKKDGAVGSRIRITDATATEPIEKQSRDTLKELASPKPSYLPFYLSNTGGQQQWSYDSATAKLRGRKVYWHSLERNYATNERTERNSSMELLGKESPVKFSFKVFYENITEKELKQLIWTLTFGENQADGTLCYKIGHGKSIGLGSCKIIVEKKTERRFQDGHYEVQETEQTSILIDEGVFATSDALASVKQVVNLNACELPVSYPAVVDAHGEKYQDKTNAHAAHKWFSHNFMVGSSPKKVLPEIGQQNDDDYALQWVTDGGVRTQPNGRFKKFFHDRGFGFVERENQPDVHVKSRVIQGYDPAVNYQGKDVYVEVRQGDKGPYATRCVVL